MTGIGVKDFFYSVRNYAYAYSESIVEYFRRSKTDTRTRVTETLPEKKPHDSAFIAVEVDKNMIYAAQHNSSLNCILVRFRDEHAIDEISALFKDVFHANNGCYPSNELRKIGNYEIGLLVHDDEAAVYGKIIGIMDYVNWLNPKNIAFSVGVGAYEKGDQRWDLIQKAQKSVFNFNDDDELSLNLERIIARQPKPAAPESEKTKEALALLKSNYDARTMDLETFYPDINAVPDNNAA